MKKLDGIHHISAITADATQNLLFYEGVMGLRLVKKTDRQDDRSLYHLLSADDDSRAARGAARGPRRARAPPPSPRRRPRPRGLRAPAGPAARVWPPAGRRARD